MGDRQERGEQGVSARATFGLPYLFVCCSHGLYGPDNAFSPSFSSTCHPRRYILITTGSSPSPCLLPWFGRVSINTIIPICRLSKRTFCNASRMLKNTICPIARYIRMPSRCMCVHLFLTPQSTHCYCYTETRSETIQRHHRQSGWFRRRWQAEGQANELYSSLPNPITKAYREDGRKVCMLMRKIVSITHLESQWAYSLHGIHGASQSKTMGFVLQSYPKPSVV